MEQFRARTLPAGELLAVGEHLSACAECRGRLGAASARLGAGVAGLRAGLDAAEATDHLPYEQLAAYVDDELNDIDRELVEGHLHLCERCEFEARELRSFAASMRPAAAPVPAAAEASTGWRARLSSIFGPENFFARRPAFGAVAAVAAVLLFAALAFILLRDRNTSDELAETRPTPAAGGVTIQPTPPPAATPTPEASPNADATPRPEASPAATPQQDATPTRTPETAETPAPPRPQPPALNDGGQVVTLAANGAVEGLGRLTPDEERAVSRALATGRVELPAGLAELARRDGALMGGAAGESFEVGGPAGVVVREARPAFSWKRLEGADAYVVTVYDAAYEEVARSRPLDGNAWTPAEALPRGRTYSWEVVALRGGRQVAKSPAPPAPEARFRILGEREAAELEATLARHPRSHLVRGTAYARAGLVADAEREFRALLSANPRSPAARRLLQNLKRR